MSKVPPRKKRRPASGRQHPAAKKGPAGLGRSSQHQFFDETVSRPSPWGRILLTVLAVMVIGWLALVIL